MPNALATTSVHLPINTLALRRGGLVSAVIRRANALAGEGIETWIEVLGAQSWLDRDAAGMRRSGHLAPRVKYRRVLDCLDRSAPDANGGVFLPAHGIRVERTERLVDIVDDGLLVQRLTLGPSKRIRYADSYGPDGSRWRRLEMDGAGRIVRDCRYYPGQQVAHTHRWLGRDGTAFLTVEADPKTREWKGAYFYRGDKLVHTDDMADVYTEAFSRATQGSPDSLVFSEFRENLANVPVSTIDDAIRRIENPAVRRAVVVHSNHLSAPYTRGSAISPTWQRLIANERAWDAFIVWTEDQRRDLIEQFALTTPVHIMPPYAPPVTNDETGTVDKDRYVTVARLQRKKRVDLAIRVFAELIKLRPSARLDVFGFGYGDAEEERVQSLVDELDVRDGVTFKEFSPTPADLYGGATALLMTSASEGFGQVIFESMAHGVPVVAYDSNYGPRTAIQDGSNGFLIPFGDLTGAAARLAELATDSQLRESMGQSSRATAAKFTPESYAREWLRICRTIQPTRTSTSQGTGRNSG